MKKNFVKECLAAVLACTAIFGGSNVYASGNILAEAGVGQDINVLGNHFTPLINVIVMPNGIYLEENQKQTIRNTLGEVLKCIPTTNANGFVIPDWQGMLGLLAGGAQNPNADGHAWAVLEWSNEHITAFTQGSRRFEACFADLLIALLAENGINIDTDACRYYINALIAILYDDTGKNGTAMLAGIKGESSLAGAYIAGNGHHVPEDWANGGGLARFTRWEEFMNALAQ